MKITSKPLALIVFVVMIGGVFFSDWMGWWQTASSKVPVTFASGEAAGEYNPADIRGSYTFSDISGLFAVPLEDLAAAFRVAPQDAAAFKVNGLEALSEGSAYEIGTASVRLFVAWYRALPFELDEDIYLPEEAAAILRAKVELNPEQAAYLDAHTLAADGSLMGAAATPAPADPVAAPSATPTPAPNAEAATAEAATIEATAVEPTEHSAPERTITGKTTFQDLLDWGVSREQIEQTCGFSLPAVTGTLLKDAVNANGGSFPAVKEALQALIP